MDNQTWQIRASDDGSGFYSIATFDGKLFINCANDENSICQESASIQYFLINELGDETDNYEILTEAGEHLSATDESRLEFSVTGYHE
ncbi:uncharacterized protein N7503_011856 [Penicillium pulvis]|uniref:uncharacterized protein n=1 Tax=Penicillium pulvis TaxID=1562058 RepID=UPI0025494542|nr:uncharacterized protein N7503_011856 [Penicillium pulvis]KAJ5786644.1 hypothetical protein N7503_011856 [Penicillium pulvis]